MAARESVDGNDALSDESSFYGNENVRAKLEQRARRPRKRFHRSVVAGAVVKRVKRPKTEAPEVPGSPHLITKIKPSVIANVQCQSLKEPGSGRSATEVLRLRPKLAGLEKATVTAELATVDKRAPATREGGDSPTFVPVDRFLGMTSAWQHGETIDAFLRRLPVQEPATANRTSDGWLWVGSPLVSSAHVQRERQRDLQACVEQGYGLLNSFDAYLAKIESANAGKAAGSITKMLRPLREQLEKDLLSLAVKTGVTSGKWMLFPQLDDLPRFWRTVAMATSENKLGPVSKAAPYSPAKVDTLICVYTSDFTDDLETSRVLRELIDLGLVVPGGKPIYYKCDAYTHLELNSGNHYKLRASLCSSKDLLDKSNAPKDQRKS